MHHIVSLWEITPSKKIMFSLFREVSCIIDDHLKQGLILNIV
jgi:hypothetical protein